MNEDLMNELGRGLRAQVLQWAEALELDTDKVELRLILARGNRVPYVARWQASCDGLVGLMALSPVDALANLEDLVVGWRNGVTEQ